MRMPATWLCGTADPAATVERRYLTQGLVLETTWTSTSGRLLVRDALSLSEDERGHDLGLNAPSILLRDAECVSGDMQVLVEWCPRPEFGLVHPHLLPVHGGLLLAARRRSCCCRQTPRSPLKEGSLAGRSRWLRETT